MRSNRRSRLISGLPVWVVSVQCAALLHCVQLDDGAVTGAKIDDATIGAAKLIDGPGSGVDADLLDGLNSGAFMPAGTDNWVNEAGDSMSGNLTLTGSSSLGVGTSSPDGRLSVQQVGANNTTKLLVFSEVYDNH